jgi:hypothetical protein
MNNLSNLKFKFYLSLTFNLYLLTLFYILLSKFTINIIIIKNKIVKKIKKFRNNNGRKKRNVKFY